MNNSCNLRRQSLIKTYIDLEGKKITNAFSWRQ